jgi:hypothetical protein
VVLAVISGAFLFRTIWRFFSPPAQLILLEAMRLLAGWTGVRYARFPAWSGALLLTSSVLLHQSLRLTARCFQLQCSPSALNLYWLLGVLPLALATGSAACLGLCLLVGTALGVETFRTMAAANGPGAVALVVQIGLILLGLSRFRGRFGAALELAGSAWVLIPLYVATFAPALWGAASTTGGLLAVALLSPLVLVSSLGTERKRAQLFLQLALCVALFGLERRGASHWIWVATLWCCSLTLATTSDRRGPFLLACGVLALEAITRLLATGYGFLPTWALLLGSGLILMVLAQAVREAP